MVLTLFPSLPRFRWSRRSGGEGNTVRTRTPQVRLSGSMLGAGVESLNVPTPVARRSRGRLHDIDPTAPPFRSPATRLHLDQASDEPDWSDPHLDFSAFSSTAVVGSAAHASPALGEPLWHACVKAVGDMLRLIDIDLDSVHVQATMPFES
jgi:hypothetical protein